MSVFVSGRAGAAAHTEGMWTPAFAEAAVVAASAPQDEATSAAYPTAVSAIVLPDGNVAFWNGLQDTENLDGPIAASGGPPDQTSKSRHLDLSGYFANGTLPGPSNFSTPENEDGDGADLFCSDQRLLADGRVLVVGGSVWVNEDEETTTGTPAEGLGRTELYGAQDARVYDPTDNGWDNDAAPDMEHGRWYPAMVTLANGDLLVAGGVGRLIYNSQLAPGQAPPEFLLPQNVRESETYDPDTGTWTSNGDSVSFPLYARLHLLPNGNVLYDTTGQAWGPFGEDEDQHTWGQAKLYDPASKTWADAPTGGTLAALGHRSGSFSVMLPLEPDAMGNYSEAKVLIGGGVLAPSPGSVVANPLTEIMTWTAGPGGGTITREPAAMLNNARWFSSGVGLPTGEVLALNGADLDEVIFPGTEAAIRQAELYDPATDTWTPLASGARDRTYHNSAVLLRDGSVLVGGHSPIVAGYGSDHGTYRSNGFKDASFEIYKPPYLFRGDRPVITSVDDADASRGQTITVTTPNAASDDLSVVLSRLPGVTHVTDADQRTVNVAHTDNGDGTISFTVPSSGGVTPDGYYYLWLIDDSGQGATPSVAEIVRIAG